MAKYKVGITVEVFNLFHVGHLNLVERFKAMCGKLVVALSQNDYVTKMKKKKTMAYPVADRTRILFALWRRGCFGNMLPVIGLFCGRWALMRE